MWSQLLLCALVGFAAASSNGWQHNMEYVYDVQGRTLTGLHEVGNQYSGIVTSGKLIIRPESDEKFMAQITHMKYSQVHANLPEGWNSDLSETKLHSQKLQLSEKPFQIIMKNGIVQDVIVSKDVHNWEANIIKSIVSQIQLDNQGKNAVNAHINQLPEQGSNNAVFKTMEDTITGKYETLYDIAPLPEYVLQSQPWLAPQPQLKNGDDEFIEIVKSTNFSRGQERPGYYHGLGDMGHFEPSSNHMGDFFLRSSNSRVIVSGSLKNYVIQSASTVNKIVVSPTLNSEQKGMVVSYLNLTLAETRPAQEQLQKPQQSQNLGSLTYSYDAGFSTSHEARYNSRRQEQEQNMYSSEERQHYRHPRSINRNSESESVESEEQWAQEQPKLSQPPQSPLLPLYVGYKGKNIKSADKIDIVQVAQKIARQIAKDIKRPEQITKEATLSKYVILSSVARIMSEKEMQQVAEQLYTKNSQDEQAEAWYAYRDAIAEAGTGPALLTIKEWIKEKKIRSEEAAEVIASMAQSVRQPTEEYMREFYALATKEEQVLKQAILNDTAVLSFATLARKVYVDQQVSHNQYPVHSFGKFYTKSGKNFVEKEVIQHLKQKLQQAIQEADSHKVLVYTRALGNVADKKILAAFEPYLEGEKQCSQFQRLQMVLAMDKLIKVHPKVARSVLYKIYQNPAEQQEIRVAAVYQLMRTSPPASMLQRMAEYTNVDTDEQVNAAVKSSIESAAQLEGEEFAELAENARAAQPLLTKQQYGIQYSGNYLRSYVQQEMNLSYKQTLQTYGSQDSVLPKGIKYALRAGLGGARRQLCIVSAMTSSIDELTNVLQQQTENQQQQQQYQEQNYGQAQQNQWSSESIAKMLNLKNEEREQLEGNLLLQLGGGATRYFTFNNRTIEQLPRIIKEFEDMLREGQNLDYTKFLNRYEVTISFPTVMSVPFIYTLDAPTLLHIKGQIRATAEPKVSNGDLLRKPHTITAHSEIRAVVSSKVQAKLGFVTPFDHQQYVSGYDKNMQVHIPIKSQIEVDLKNQQLQAQVQPLEQEKNVQLLHYSTWPYTAKHDILELEPISNHHDTKTIYAEKEPKTQINQVFGKHSGLAVRVEYVSEQRFFDALWLKDQILRNDQTSGLMAPLCDETIMHSKLNVEYAAQESTARKVQFRMGYENQHHKHAVEGESADIKNFSQLPRESRARQQQLAKMAASGIQNADVSAFDFAVEFDGQNKVEYTASAAIASAQADEHSRVLFFLKKHSANHHDNKPYEIAMSAKARVPNTNGLNFAYALKFDPTIVSEMQLAFGENHESATKVQVNGKFEQSESRKRYLQKQPRAQECREEMQEGNQQLPACANLTAEANLMDRVHFKIQYQNVHEQVRNLTYKLYNGLRYLGYYNLDENTLNAQGTGNDNQIELEARFDADLEAVNVTIRSQKMKANFDQIRVNPWAKQIFVAHPVFPVSDRVMSEALAYDTYKPFCAVDKTAANTFDNKTYPIELGQSWHVMLQYVPSFARQSHHWNNYQQQQKEQQMEQFAVLVRDTKSQDDNKEIKMTIRTPETQGKLIEINLKPAQGRSEEQGPRVEINGQEAQYDKKNCADIEDGYIQIYALPNGEVKVNVHDSFYVIYDGQRVRLSATHDKFRGAVRGLCGTFTGEEATDFLTPKNCILRKPQEFAATYAIQPEGRVQEQQSRAQNSPCYYEENSYVNVISDSDAGRSHQEYRSNHKQNQHRQSGSDNESCTKHQTRYVVQEDSNEICFTIRAYPTCSNSCTESRMTEKKVEVHCVQRTNVAELWKKQIQRGASPDFSQKTPNRSLRIEVPESCHKY